MYSAVPPRPGGQTEPGDGWGLLRAARRVFPEPATGGWDAGRTARLDTYLTDLLDPYGLKLEPGALDRGGQSYAEMGSALVEAVVPADDPVDLLVLAHAIPDTHPGRATAVYLSHVCPGRPMAFAVSDQGVGAAFTGLRLIREYAGSGGPRRALLLVVEQAALPYDPGVPVPVPAVSAGVALLFGDSVDSDDDDSGDTTDTPVRARRVAEAAVHARCPDEALADRVGAVASVPTATTAILGTGLAADDRRWAGIDHVRAAPAGQPFTGAWWELAGLLASAGSAPTGRLLLADLEPGSRSLCLAAFDLERAGSTA